jgi:hypothetical protein
MRRAGCNLAPARATRRRARALGSIRWRSARGPWACNRRILPTDADRPLGRAPSSGRANKALLANVTMNSARLPTKTNCTMAGTPATIPAATPPDPSKVANNRTAKSRNTCFEPFYATSALVESCPLRETRNNRSFAESQVGNNCAVVGRRLTVIPGQGARDTPKGAVVRGASFTRVLLGVRLRTRHRRSDVFCESAT